MNPSAHQILAVIFWLCLGATCYTYFIYPLLLWCLQPFAGRRRQVDASAPAELPTITMILAAHNERQCLPAKIANCLAIDYPPERLRFLIGSDGSTDGTDALLRELDHPRFTAVCEPRRGGKAGMLNRLVPLAGTELIVFSDANTMYEPDALRKLVRPFADPRVGIALGRLVLEVPDATPDACETEGLYWRYENRLKTWESSLGAVPSINGAICAIRRELYAPLPPAAVTEDQVMGMRILARGYRCVFVPAARARENVSTFHGELTRRVRISAGNFQSLLLAPGLLHPRCGRTFWTFASHKLIRWLVPFCLLAMLGVNLALSGTAFYGATLLAQGLFYLAGLVGAILGQFPPPLRLLTVPRYFLAMNAAIVLGLLRFLTHRQSPTWTRAPR